jgi:hypothetical protein
MPGQGIERKEAGGGRGGKNNLLDKLGSVLIPLATPQLKTAGTRMTRAPRRSLLK